MYSKTFRIVGMVIVFIIGQSAFGQLEIGDDGNVGIGVTPYSNYKLRVQSVNGNYNYGIRVWADAGNYTNYGVSARAEDGWYSYGIRATASDASYESYAGYFFR
ncbi:MAG: hypothetical protein K9N46_02135 [Candidatus Marinimicrobia bacterium]|nr:hypothetical protein [Candidatus Neomarinimicrobiota bacterium]MCF7828303.1 hypothetical protein [Candidatus Neomarinimicrobiota bacterium]MCF7879522.1 hypothetical protein [Candidatus Neomarinimicrobiota bacterium]